MDFKNTKTEQNLIAALEGESLARSRYSFFAAKARLEGDKELATLFERMEANETAHAAVWYKLLHGGMDDSLENLRVAAEAEYGEWRSMYPEFAKQAREDGLDGIAIMFEKIAEIEKDHESQFLELSVRLNAGKSLSAEQLHRADQLSKSKSERLGYRCLVCGAIFEARPDVCEVCGAVGFFEVAPLTEA